MLAPPIRTLLNVILIKYGGATNQNFTQCNSKVLAHSIKTKQLNTTTESFFLNVLYTMTGLMDIFFTRLDG